MELKAHLAKQPSEPAQFREWMLRKFELEEYAPIARRKVEQEQAQLAEAVQEARRVLLRAWSERAQQADRAYEDEEARLEQLRREAAQRREDVYNSRDYVEQFDGSEL